MNRRQLLKTGLFSALAVVAAPVVKIAQVIPLPQWASWSPWSKWNHSWMRHRKGIDDPNQLELEIILQPIIRSIDVNVIVTDDGVELLKKGKAAPQDAVT